ncbi:type II secretion system F family protein [Actinomycetospora sp. Odt1-22]|uniref:Type II secretion system F family protein n=1 Tax=Actinomycetospora termitidis TaxID=3053470 RepID=A0ABT7M1G2_9PSEU|nr:type II secretion system F family protein [Actinomycetospora sp. Odt1-22]MDL5154492.1 type II secretion system F family protein [Actinomycetospora sp. Odt1-22]
MTLAAAVTLLAVALLAVPGPVDAARRLGALDRPAAPSRPRSRRPTPRDPWREAGAWDELAACLRAGLPLDVAVRAVADSAPVPTAQALVRVADLVALGADPAEAWAPALDEPSTARLARAARRSARSGAAVADVAVTVAADVRAEAAEAVAARAERAGVLVAGPLGLCFLPAFLALGIAPVVIGLASPLLERT